MYHIQRETSHTNTQSFQSVGLVLRLFGWRAGVHGRERVEICLRRLWTGRGGRLHADIAVEELGGIIVGAAIAGVVVMVVAVGVVGKEFVVVALASAGGVVARGNLGHGLFEPIDEICEVVVGVLVEVDARLGEAGDHGADEVLRCAVDEGGETADDGEGVEEAGSGDEWWRLGRLCEEFRVGDYWGMIGLALLDRGWRFYAL